MFTTGEPIHPHQAMNRDESEGEKRGRGTLTLIRFLFLDVAGPKDDAIRSKAFNQRGISEDVSSKKKLKSFIY